MEDKCRQTETNQFLLDAKLLNKTNSVVDPTFSSNICHKSLIIKHISGVSPLELEYICNMKEFVSKYNLELISVQLK